MSLLRTVHTAMFYSAAYDPLADSAITGKRTLQIMLEADINA